MKTLVDLIEEYRIELKPIGKDIYRGYCKIHEDSAGGKPQFTYYSSTESWYCYRCNIGGDAVRLVAEMEHISYAEAKNKLLGTEAEQREERLNGLEDLDFDWHLNYNLQLNFGVREKLRQMFYKYPEKAQDILMAMKSLDEELKNKITLSRMVALFKKYAEFENTLVERCNKG